MNADLPELPAFPHVPPFVGDSCAIRDAWARAYGAACAAAAMERAAQKLETYHGFDKHGVAGFIRAAK
jgi:hypothetical protein